MNNQRFPQRRSAERWFDDNCMNCDHTRSTCSTLNKHLLAFSGVLAFEDKQLDADDQRRLGDRKQKRCPDRRTK